MTTAATADFRYQMLEDGSVSITKYNGTQASASSLLPNARALFPSRFRQTLSTPFSALNWARWIPMC